MVPILVYINTDGHRWRRSAVGKHPFAR